MSNHYDPQYSTVSNFSSPVMREFVIAQDLVKLNHWLTNGEPHSRLISEAFVICIQHEWNDGLDAIWSAEWLSEKDFISIGWETLVGTNYHDSNVNNLSEQWLIDKTFNEHHLSPAEFNTLSVKLLELSIKLQSLSVHYWKLFLRKEVQLKGTKANDLFSSLLYNRFFNDNPNIHELQEKHEPATVDIYQGFIDDIIEHGIELPYFTFLSLFFENKMKLFHQLIDSTKVKVRPQDAFIVMSYLSIYYNSYKVIALKEDKKSNENQLDIILQSFINKGLTSKVIFKAKEINSKYKFAFNSEGYLDLTALKLFKNTSHRLDGLVAYHTPRIDSDDPIDVEFYLGDIVYSHPVEVYPDTYQYVELTAEQHQAIRNLMDERLKTV